MHTKQTSELLRCITDERLLANSATNFAALMYLRRIEGGCVAELRARKAPGYSEPVRPENPKVLYSPRPK